MKTFCVVVPSMGRSGKLLDGLVDSCWCESHLVDLLIVWNGPAAAAPTPAEDFARVVCPGSNLGWLGGSNFGAGIALGGDYSAICFCNDDVVLSGGFFDGLDRALDEHPRGLLSPVYHTLWRDHYLVGIQQEPTPHDRADSYKPVALEQRRRVLDGTCLVVPVEVWRHAGPFDRVWEGANGCGATRDLCRRASQPPLSAPCHITGRAFLEHRIATTAKAVHGKRYMATSVELMRGIARRSFAADYDAWFAPIPELNPPNVVRD
ncbi:MAG: hypothetical protein SF028_15485 [Candidatus Sumerlaeia bacterium]|nr:hypothetical protein [Candidatus Sumerlaeia bacterium]